MNDNEKEKLCKDCEYCKKSLYVYVDEKCSHIRTVTTHNLINGETKQEIQNTNCWDERYPQKELCDADPCGQNGRYWKARKDK